MSNRRQARVRAGAVPMTTPGGGAVTDVVVLQRDTATTFEAITINGRGNPGKAIGFDAMGVLGAMVTVPQGNVAVMTSLRSLPTAGLASGAAVQLQGYYASGDGGGGVFVYDQNSGLADDGGTVIAPASGTGRWMRVAEGAVNVRWFGAKGDGVADDTGAIQAAATATPVHGMMVIPAGTHLLGSTVTLNHAMHVVGPGKILTTGGYPAFNLTSFVGGSFDGVAFDSTYAGTSVHAAIRGVSPNLSGISIRNCSFGRVNIVLRDGTEDVSPGISGISITNCHFTGDYTGALGGDLSNIIDFHGVAQATVEGNRFNAREFERFMKVTRSCRDINITGNIFKATSAIGKQAIDMFADTRQAVISNNVFDLAGSWTCGVEGKNGDNNPDFSEPADISVTSNLFVFSSTATAISAIAFYGMWGLTGRTLPSSSVTVADNLIRIAAPNSTSAVITVRGMTSALVSGNTLDVADALDFQNGINADNNQSAVITANSLRNCWIQTNGTASHPNGTIYANSPEQLIVCGNNLHGFQKNGGIYIVNCAGLTSVAIVGNDIHATVGTATVALVYIATSTVAKLTVIGNTGSTDTNYSYYGTATITTKSEVGNGWQTFGGTSTYLPVWGTDGLSLGTSGLYSSGGNVGIANARSYQFLDHAGTARSVLQMTAVDNVQLLAPTGATTGNLLLGTSNSTGDILFYFNSVELARLDRFGRLTIGGSAGPVRLTSVETVTTSPRGIMSWQSNDGTEGAHIYGRKSRGPATAATTVVSGDNLLRLIGSGYDGAAHREMASIDMVSTGTIGSNRVPTKMLFKTATDAATSVLTTALTLNADQSAAFAGTVATLTTTVGALPAAGTVGRRAFVTDANAATFGTVAAGGGSNKVPVHDDGTAWKIG